MTQEFLQDAIVEDLKGFFSRYQLTNSLGVEREIKVYPHDAPIRQGDDEAQDPEAPPEPYVIVRTMGGGVQDENSPHVVEIVLVVCVYDRDPERQGYRDALHIVNEIYRHYAANGIVGKRYSLQYPIKWTTPDDDTHPYYFAAMALNFEAPAVIKEVPET
ncbi:MAG: hypothetical protein LKK00_01620 [Intestinimonas sp.]|jgi:hypothetical protein|nr:hypothetical protein [Intestinimonas sp.]